MSGRREPGAMRRGAGILVYRARPELAVLLVRESRGAGRGTWGIPKGGVEPGEDAERAARRETCEETSVVVRGRLDDLGVVEHAYPNGRGRTRVFAAVAPAGAAPLPTLPEVDRAEFVEIGAAWRRMHPEQRLLLDRLLVLMALSIYGDEPGILVQRSRIDVQLQGTRTFIRDASRAEVAP